jgi:4-hydroxyphenylpyruvate dioxygenase
MAEQKSLPIIWYGDGVKIIALEDDVAWLWLPQPGAKRPARCEESDKHGVIGWRRFTRWRNAARFATGRIIPPLRPATVPLIACRSNRVGSHRPYGGNVQLGKMNHWVNFYHQVMGFRQLLHFDDKDISTEYSALMSKVMQNGNGRVKFPINEPADGRRKSQIEEYLDYYLSPGVQHLALATGDILGTVYELKARGIEFLRVPDAYYDLIPERVGEIKESMETIKEPGILVDRDDSRFAANFSRPIQDPTMFIEVIQRHGSRVSVRVISALFEALELNRNAGQPVRAWSHFAPRMRCLAQASGGWAHPAAGLS